MFEYNTTLADAKRLGKSIYCCTDDTHYIKQVVKHININKSYDTFIRGEDVSQEYSQMFGMYLGLVGALVLEMSVNKEKSEAQLVLYIQTLKYSEDYGKYLTYRDGDTVTITVPYKALFDFEVLEGLVFHAMLKEVKHRRLKWWLVFKTCEGLVTSLMYNGKVAGIRYTLTNPVSKSNSSCVLDVDIDVFNNKDLPKVSSVESVQLYCDCSLATMGEITEFISVLNVSELSNICDILKGRSFKVGTAEFVYSIKDKE